MTKPMYYLGHRVNAVYESPETGHCPFCGDHISVAGAVHNGATLDICLGCSALFDYKEADHATNRI